MVRTTIAALNPQTYFSPNLYRTEIVSMMREYVLMNTSRWNTPERHVSHHALARYNSCGELKSFWMHLDCEIAFFVLFHSLSLKFIVSFKTQNTVVHSERIFSYEAWMVKRFVRESFCFVLHYEEEHKYLECTETKAYKILVAYAKRSIRKHFQQEGKEGKGDRGQTFRRNAAGKGEMQQVEAAVKDDANTPAKCKGETLLSSP
ncbi:hypothetical protein WUBG_01040 [Wuchereria bancrofti]|uniref:Uncharacterized protein n=1 Tax=Wuchereria bancrofti TaxID=6293 RepID=J9FL18_WUCBA|nr:hypothetical protein WUBG_01040 [Wuchereria bancrofti]